MSVVDVYAVEHGEYSDRRTEVLFTTEALADAYIAARIAAAKRDDRDHGWPEDDYSDRYEVVVYQLWTTVPVLPVSLGLYDDVPALQP